MGFFDIFKKKQSAEAAPEQAEQQREELTAGLEKTKTGLFSKLARAVAGRSTIDSEVLDNLEEVLITSDVGVETTVKIIDRIEKRVARDKYMNASELQKILREEIADLLEQSVGSAENFQMLYELADVLGGEVGASRAAVDAGFAEHERQIGQTGTTVRPKLYIACGISGQIQHIAGMQESSMIISINSDPDAPINTIADYVITGTVEEVIPKMIKYYKKNSK